jgi:small subunit ribosomal protein S6
MANANKQYEAMFLFPAGASAELEKSQTMVRTMIERHGGSILVLKKWDERKLAYELNGQKRGVYIIAFFTAPGTAVSHIERDVNLSEDILRVLVTDASHLNKDEMEAVEPQPIVKEERPSWEGGYGGFGGGFGGGNRDRGPRREEAGAGKD